jgi:site-specific recombinase XerD
MKTTNKLNFDASMKFANDSLNFSSPTNTRKEQSNNALGLLIKIGLKTSMRVSDILAIEHTQFKERNDGTTWLTYKSIKSKVVVSIPVSHDLLKDINRYNKKMEDKYGSLHDNLFFNYQTKSMFTREWATKCISKANKQGKMGEVVNVAGTHSIRKTAVNAVFDRTQNLKLAQMMLGHKKITTTAIYIKDEAKEMEQLLLEQIG